MVILLPNANAVKIALGMVVIQAMQARSGNYVEIGFCKINTAFDKFH